MNRQLNPYPFFRAWLHHLRLRTTFLLPSFLLLLAVLGLHCYVWLSLAAVSRGYSLVVEHGLLMVSSLVVDGAWTSHGEFSCCGWSMGFSW